jgi:hypothetical protein
MSEEKDASGGDGEAAPIPTGEAAERVKDVARQRKRQARSSTEGKRKKSRKKKPVRTR